MRYVAAMPTLAEIMGRPEARHALVADAARVVDAEVHDKHGLGGMAIKAAFAMVKAVKPGIVPDALDGLFPEWAEKLDPILAARPAGGPAWGAFLVGRTSEVVEALLAVTDARAQRNTHATLRGAYFKLRPSAEKHVAAAVPRLAKVVEKHVGA